MNNGDYAFAFRQGAKQERDRLLALLREKRALRDSIVGNDWVLYTQDGAIDITKAELEGQND